MRTNKLLGKLSSSLEAIAFQTNTRLLDEIAQTVNDLRVTGTQSTGANKVLDRLATVVKKHTNMSVRVNVSKGNLSASIFVAPLTRNSPVHSGTVKGILMLPSAGQAVRKLATVGTVDLKTGRVGGVFASLPATDMMIGDDLITSQLLTDKEVAAIILHELGHLFTYFYTLSKTYRTSYILDQLSRYPDMERKIQIEFLQAVKDTTGVDSTVETVDPTELSVKIIAESTRDIQRDLGTKYLDNQLTEILSDQYATRFGAGVHLTVALDKIGRDASMIAKHDQYRSTGETVAGISLSMVFTLLPVVSFASMGGFLPYMTYTLTSPTNWVRALRLSLCIGLGFSLIKLMFGVPVGMEPEERYTYIRNDLIGILKNRELPKDIVQSTLEDITKVNELIGDLNKFQSLSTFIKESIYGVITGNTASKSFTNRLEALANNQLFAQAAAFQLNGDTHVS